MKVIIAGGRDFMDYRKLEAAADAWPGGITEVVCGGAQGADRFGDLWAKANGIPVKYFHAHWGIEGKAAGPIRNSAMAAYSDGLLAFWDGKSSGTRDMISKARKKKLTVTVVPYDP